MPGQDQERMRACYIDRYGGPGQLRLGQRPRPQPGDGEALVRVAAVGLNPVDYKTRDGKVRILLPYPMPQILGNELCGEIMALGRNAAGFSVGQRVCTRVAKLSAGAFAEYAAVPTSMLAAVPDSVSDVDAAALPLAGLTAWQCLTEVLQLQPGQRVLIHAGAGGVGHIAVQLAHQMGAVVATTASPARFDFLRSLGASELVDYRQQRFEDCIAPVDAVLDTQGGDILLRSIAHTRRGGRVVTIGGLPTPEIADEFAKPFWVRWLFAWISRRERALARSREVTFRYWFMRPDGTQLAELISRVAAGQLNLRTQVFEGFDRFPEVFAALESGRTVGKLVVRLPRIG
jgi:NADPH:quinone reductase-like Zn-dependent oxidoreductase